MAASVPTRKGVLLLCGSDIEVRDHVITGHDSTGILVVSYKILELLNGTTLDDPRRVDIHGNGFDRSGGSPKGGLLILQQPKLEEVLCDGLLNARRPLRRLPHDPGPAGRTSSYGERAETWCSAVEIRTSHRGIPAPMAVL